MCIYFNVNDHTFDNFLINNSKLGQDYIISFNVCQAHDNCTLISNFFSNNNKTNCLKMLCDFTSYLNMINDLEGSFTFN